jgi:hypothetical protein
METCRRIGARIDALKRICDDPGARRMQLWLRALEKQDTGSIERLRQTDPTIESQVKSFVSRKRPEAPREARDDLQIFYGWLQDQHFEEYANLELIFCCCPTCISRGMAEDPEELDEDDYDEWSDEEGTDSLLHR